VKFFAFRLERLLHVRCLREEIARREFAAAQAAVEAQQANVAALGGERAAAWERVRGLRGAGVDVLRLAIEDQALAALAGRIRAEESKLSGLEKEREGRRSAVAEAIRAVRVLERFRDKQFRAWRRESARRDLKVLDEAAQARRSGS